MSTAEHDFTDLPNDADFETMLDALTWRPQTKAEAEFNAMLLAERAPETEATICASYHPWNLNPVFQAGLDIYMNGYDVEFNRAPLSEVHKQAFDRGMECAMRVARLRRTS
jgi:hypothetical protein